jgi:signal transduction histidine kinase/CheY-like chemotaxis protein
MRHSSLNPRPHDAANGAPLSIRRRLTILLAILALIFLSGVFGWCAYERYVAARVTEKSAADTESLVAAIVDLEGSALNSFVTDYSFWDELVDFAASRDQAWSEKNLDPSIATFKISGVWVFDKNRELVYTVPESAGATVTRCPLEPSLLGALFTDSPFRHFFVRGDFGVMEIRGATLHRQDDAERKGNGLGFLIAGRVLSEEYVAHIASITQSSMRLIDPAAFAPAVTRTNEEGPRFLWPVRSWDNSVVASMEIARRDPIRALIAEATGRATVIAGSLVVVVLALFSWGVVRWVSRPLRVVSAALRQESSANLAELGGERTEFGAIAQLIERAFRERAELEREVAERKAMEIELKKARDRAERLAAAKASFLANMSHEIRTPMNGIIGMADLLAAGQLGPDEADKLATIRSSADSLLTIINDILDLSKIEAGKLRIEVADFNLRRAFEDVARLLSAKASDKGIELNALVPPGVPEDLRGDAVRVRQILINLVGNAVKFTEKGEVTMEAALVRSTETQVVIRLSVKDTGVGIPDNRQSAVFDSFVQADDSTTRRFGGTGLGLTICRDLAGLLGGKIWLQSTVGRGSQFFVELPFERAQVAAAEIPADDGLAGVRALYVDDNAAARRVVRTYLEGARCAVTCVPSADEGMAAARHAVALGEPYDLILIDWLMPDRDGVGLAREIRCDPQLAGVPLVLLTGHLVPENAAEVAAMGVDLALAKPLRRAELISDLRGLLGRPPARALPAAAPAAAPVAAGLQGRQVLLAEDNLVNQKVATMMLERMGCHVDVAGNGVEALAKARAQAFDVILMDCQMPEMDGLEATRELRRLAHDGRVGRVPVIAMTANAMQGDRERCLDAGMDDYLTKPVRAPELAALLQKWVR